MFLPEGFEAVDKLVHLISCERYALLCRKIIPSSTNFWNSLTAGDNWAVVKVLWESTSRIFLFPLEFVAVVYACILGIGLALNRQKGHVLPCFCETKRQ
ncbi:MAG: hypothetical protein LBI05_04670, partial [Planctomycetaceae bacterium]|nr:hypothetical protein [Planctomycetaceae bacterium]